MRTWHANNAIRYVRRLGLLREPHSVSDAQLLDAFLAGSDEAAFASLVKRHGPMVLGVCRRVLRNAHDAEDAFQATFLVLFRKAARIGDRELLGNWLYGVAVRAALKMKSADNARRERERLAGAEKPPGIPGPADSAELLSQLDAELSQLPDKYRAPVVLCDIEGLTRTEAARRLGWPVGTLNWRLSRAREMLAMRLRRRGVEVSGAVATSALLAQSASATVPPALMAATTKSALSAAAAGTAAMIANEIGSLTRGTVHAMFAVKLKSVTAFLVLAGVVGAAGVGLSHRVSATEQPASQNRQSDQSDEQRMRQEIRTLRLRAEEARREADQLRGRLTAVREASRDDRTDLRYQASYRLRIPVDSCPALFRYRVPVETGFSEMKDGGRIDIVEIWGTRPRIEVGGQYLVRGKYKLPPGARHGKVYFFATAGGAWGAITTTLDLQMTEVEKPEGKFTLVHGMLGDGNFHLVLADPENYSRMFANVYFGSGANVLRTKP